MRAIHAHHTWGSRRRSCARPGCSATSAVDGHGTRRCHSRQQCRHHSRPGPSLLRSCSRRRSSCGAKSPAIRARCATLGPCVGQAQRCDRVALQSRAAGRHAGWSRTSSGVGRIYGGRLSSAEPLSRPQTACHVLPAGQRSATQRVEACQPAAAGHGSDAGAPRWRVRRRVGARTSRSGRAGRPESPARCRAGACRPPWPTPWRQAALAAGGPSALAESLRGREHRCRERVLAGMLHAILRGSSCPTP